MVQSLLVLTGWHQAHEVWVQAPTKIGIWFCIKQELAYGITLM